jgi:hypothetical protein
MSQTAPDRPPEGSAPPPPANQAAPPPPPARAGKKDAQAAPPPSPAPEGTAAEVAPVLEQRRAAQARAAAPEEAEEAPKLPPAPRPVLGVQVLRRTGEEALEPITEDGGFTWLLPFAPRDGESRNVHPGQTFLVQTGLRLYVPPGVVCAVFQPYANGRPGLLIPVMEVDHRYDGELEVPVRVPAEHRVPLSLYPGQKPYPLVLRAYAVGERIPLRVDRGADPLK